jgi:hypothetical protein
MGVREWVEWVGGYLQLRRLLCEHLVWANSKRRNASVKKMSK